MRVPWAGTVTSYWAVNSPRSFFRNTSRRRTVPERSRSAEDVAAVGLGDEIGLQTERVLIEGDELLVLQQGKCGAFDVGKVTADEQGRRHDAPHAEVGLVFLGGHRAANLEHVHVVVVAVVAVGREVEVLSDDALHRFPPVVDVACGTPGEGGIVNPRARIGPAAGVQP